MKKLFATLLVAAFALIGTQAYAQLGVNAGYLNSNLTTSGSKPVNYNGFYAGVTYRIPIVAGLSVAPGVYYSLLSTSKSDGVSFLGFTQSGTSTHTEHGLNAAINLDYGFQIARDTRVFLFAGPTFQYGLSSQSKYTAEGVVSGTTKADWYENGNYGRFNIFLGGGAGVEVAGIQITVGYDYGLMNLYKGNGDSKRNRSGLKIGVGFLF